MSNPSITEDEVIRAGAEILLKGGVMLSKACPDCFSPLYKLQGKTLCVKCKKHFILVDTEQEMTKSSSPPVSSSALPQTDSSYIKTQKIPFSYDFSNLPPELYMLRQSIKRLEQQMLQDILDKLTEIGYLKTYKVGILNNWKITEGGIEYYEDM
ncbi:hypothetical protein ES708_31126 [subsurface metagenome]